MDHAPQREMPTVFLANLRDAPAVALQPDVVPRAWQLAEDEDRSRYLLCLLPTGSTTRVTTQIVAIDLVQRYVTTQSGRRYNLAQPPAREQGLLMVMAAHAALFNLKVAVTAGEDLWGLMLRGVH